MSTPYRYEPRVLTESRMADITELIVELRDEAASDIEDKREIYEALSAALAAHDARVEPLV